MAKGFAFVLLTLLLLSVTDASYPTFTPNPAYKDLDKVFPICVTFSLASLVLLSSSNQSILFSPPVKVYLLTYFQPGRMCMFHAPKGAYIFGHVGWAFSITGTSQWICGSTEEVDTGTLLVPPGPMSNDES